MSDSEDFQNASTDYGPLTDRQAENIADLAARRAEERLYTAVGRSVVKRFVLAIGAAATVATAWLNDWIHLGPK